MLLLAEKCVEFYVFKTLTFSIKIYFPRFLPLVYFCPLKVTLKKAKFLKIRLFALRV